MTALDSYAGNSTLGTEGILFLADIALAVGAKLEVAATSLYTRLENSLSLRVSGPASAAGLDVRLRRLDLHLHHPAARPHPHGLGVLRVRQEDNLRRRRPQLLHLRPQPHHQHQQLRVG